MAASREQDLSDSLWLRVSLAFVWLSTAVHVLHPYYRAVGSHTLDQLGAPQGLMWVACALSLGLGFHVLLRPANRLVTIVQVTAVAFFTVVLVAIDPRLLVHPLGVLTKNIPFITAVLAAHLLTRPGSTAVAAHALRLGVAAIWVTEGVIPKILFQSSWERHFVAAHGFSAFEPGPLLIVVGVLEAASGVLSLLLPQRPRRVLLYLQAAALVILPAWVIANDTLLWLHPFGPLQKNVPILVATLIVARRCCGPKVSA